MLTIRISLAIVLATFASSVIADDGSSCSSVKHCTFSAPCCSEFNFCGDSNPMDPQFCLGGCNPLSSYKLDSCKPNPICKDATYVFKDNSRILSNSSFFEGNASSHDWIVDKGNIMNSGGELVLLLTEQNGGTRISSTRYVHYGTITARLKTGRWKGIVTAFITMSDIKDEIDWEFPGTAVTEAQSNFFWQGIIPPQTDGQTHKGLSDTFANYHDYTIDWQPDTLTFLIDGKPVRTVKRTNERYPTTPARVQLSLWPAGISSSPPGTVQWAGGMINWNDPDYKSAGNFYARVQSVTVKCADPTRPGVNITSYVYGANTSQLTPGISFSNRSTLLNGASSLLGADLPGARAVVLAALVGLALTAQMLL